MISSSNLKGWDTSLGVSQPFRLHSLRASRPRALPWATLSQPFGLKNCRAARYFFFFLPGAGFSSAFTLSAGFSFGAGGLARAGGATPPGGGAIA